MGTKKRQSQPRPENGKYQNLIFNTILFAIATFAPKLITFLMQSVITRNLELAEYGGYDQIQSFCNLVLPIVYITISEAVIRFGSDGETKKTDVFTTATLVLLVGYGIFLVLYPILKAGDTMGQYAVYVYPYVLASALRTIVGHFVRSLGNVRLFAVDGIITTFSTTILNLIFLIPLNMGATAPIIGTIVADALSAVFMFVMIRGWQYFSLPTLDFKVAKDMIVYSIFMMPTAVMWWIINTSNRSIIRAYHGLDAQGLYGAASRIPALVTMVSQVFMQAWQMSAFSEAEEGREEFFAHIFKSYYTFLFVAISGLVLIIRPFIAILFDAKFYASWQYVPFLLLGIGLSCLVTFLGTIYNTHKQNFMITLTTAIGAVLNYILNRLLIPSIGVQGAAIATYIAYLTVFFIRLIDTQRFMDLRIQPVQLTLNIVLLVVQIAISLKQPAYGVLYQIGIFVVIAAINFKHILFLLRQLLGALTRRKSEKAPSS